MYILDSLISYSPEPALGTDTEIGKEIMWAEIVMVNAADADPMVVGARVGEVLAIALGIGVSKDEEALVPSISPTATTTALVPMDNGVEVTPTEQGAFSKATIGDGVVIEDPP